jgi:hypothetical protein
MSARMFAAAAAFAVLVFAVPSAEAEDDALSATTLRTAAQHTCDSFTSDSNFACRVVTVASRCERGDGSACAVAAKVNAAASVHDVARGAVVRPLLARACRLDAATCIDASFSAMHAYGDEQLARAFMISGCERNKAVCREGAAAFAVGRNVPRDVALARWLDDRASR